MLLAPPGSLSGNSQAMLSTCISRNTCASKEFIWRSGCFFSWSNRAP